LKLLETKMIVPAILIYYKIEMICVKTYRNWNGNEF